MSHVDSPIRILAVGCRPSGPDANGAVIVAATGREALVALRSSDVDVLLTTHELAGVPVWGLVQSVRRVRPKLRWWLVAAGLAPDDEVIARSFGVARILPAPPTVDAIREALAAEPGRRALAVSVTVPAAQPKRSATAAAAGP